MIARLALAALVLSLASVITEETRFVRGEALLSSADWPLKLAC